MMAPRLDLAVQKGCQMVEPDNVCKYVTFLSTLYAMYERFYVLCVGGLLAKQRPRQLPYI